MYWGGGTSCPDDFKSPLNTRKWKNCKTKIQKKRPPQSPTPHHYPGIHRIYTYALHKPCGMFRMSENGQLRNFADI